MRCYILLLICILPLQLSAQEATPSETTSLQKQIKDCKDKLALAKMQAYIAGSDADRYLGEDWEDYQRAITQQEQYDAQAQELQVQLNELEKQLEQKTMKAK